MKRILIVDDQADLRRLVRWSLELVEGDVELHEAATADACLEKAQALKPDLLLLDVMLPGAMNGLDVCRQLRSTPGLDATQIVLVSARGQADDVKQGIAAGANAYVVKPFSPQRLLETVEKLLVTP